MIRRRPRNKPLLDRIPGPALLAAAFLLLAAGCGQDDKRTSVNPVIPRTTLPETTVTISGRVKAEAPEELKKRQQQLEEERQRLLREQEQQRQLDEQFDWDDPARPQDQTQPAQDQQPQPRTTGSRGERDVYLGLHLIEDHGDITLPIDHETTFTGAAFTFAQLSDRLLDQRGFVVTYRGPEQLQKAFWRLAGPSSNIGDLDPASTFHAVTVRTALENDRIGVRDMAFFILLGEFFELAVEHDPRQLRRETGFWAELLVRVADREFPVQDAPPEQSVDRTLARRRAVRAAMFLLAFEELLGERRPQAAAAMFKSLIKLMLDADLDGPGWGVARKRKSTRLRYLASFEDWIAPRAQPHPRRTPPRASGALPAPEADPATPDRVSDPAAVDPERERRLFGRIESELDTLDDQRYPGHELARVNRLLNARLYNPELSMKENLLHAARGLGRAWADTDTLLEIPHPILAEDDIEPIHRAAMAVVKSFTDPGEEPQ